MTRPPKLLHLIKKGRKMLLPPPPLPLEKNLSLPKLQISDQCPGASTTYPSGATFMQFATKVSTNDNQVAKAAMMTAEGAMNFMICTISGDPGSLPRKEAETGKESTTMGTNQSFDTTGAGSDLAVVLNAWYVAGFYTSRYLMQQSMKNSRQG